VVHGLVGSDRGGDERLLNPMQLIQLALKRGNARRALSHRQRVVRHALPGPFVLQLSDVASDSIVVAVRPAE
jgi:hypothetical protein